MLVVIYSVVIARLRRRFKWFDELLLRDAERARNNVINSPRLARSYFGINAIAELILSAVGAVASTSIVLVSIAHIQSAPFELVVATTLTGISGLTYCYALARSAWKDGRKALGFSPLVEPPMLPLFENEPAIGDL